MRRQNVLLLAGLLAVGCAANGDGASGGEPARARGDAIIGGTQDDVHTAVVAVGSDVARCSGTIVQVKDESGYVLTAAHCCTADHPPLVVTLGADADAPDATLSVAPGSVTADPAFDLTSHDFCVLQFGPAPTDTPFIPPMTPAEDDLQPGTAADLVGYGVAGTLDAHDVNNHVRNHIVDTIDQVDVATITFDTSEGGPCNGDSGGPVLTPVDAAQDQQRVAAVISFGDASCAVYGASGRVSFAYDGFIRPALEAPTIAPPDAGSSASSSSAAATGSGGAGGSGGGSATAKSAEPVADTGCACAPPASRGGYAAIAIALLVSARARRGRRIRSA